MLPPIPFCVEDLSVIGNVLSKLVVPKGTRLTLTEDLPLAH